VSPADEVEVVFFQEIGDDVGAEDVADAALTLAPALEVDFGVAP